MDWACPCFWHLWHWPVDVLFFSGSTLMRRPQMSVMSYIRLSSLPITTKARGMGIVLPSVFFVIRMTLMGFIPLSFKSVSMSVVSMSVGNPLITTLRVRSSGSLCEWKDRFSASRNLFMSL